MKPTYKDSQLSVRINGEKLQEMKAAATALNLALSDYVVKLFDDSQKQNNLQNEWQIEKVRLEARLEALERAVFHQSQAA